jgi:hypothetical protein
MVSFSFPSSPPVRFQCVCEITLFEKAKAGLSNQRLGCLATQPPGTAADNILVKLDYLS